MLREISLPCAQQSANFETLYHISQLAVLFKLRIFFAFCSPAKCNVALLAVSYFLYLIFATIFNLWEPLVFPHSEFPIYHGDTGLL